ncbi:MAG: hypothetical protein EBR82_35810 [Caulobacteraceae bacterium]|nr:hypothetical protein [Caulobacteraceae bacterium]
MAAPVTSAATFIAGGNGITYASQVNGEWVQVHDDASSTAIGSSVLLNPASYSSSVIHPLIVDIGTKIRFIGEYAVGTSVITTSPTIRVFGADKIPNASGVYPSGTVFWRLDANTFNAAATTLTLTAVASSQQDATTAYTTPLSNDGYSLLGAKSVLVLHEVAGAISGGATTTIQISAQVLNV